MAGRREAAAELYRRHVRGVKAAARRSAPGAGPAELADLVQETWAEALASAHQWSGACSWHTWTWRVCRRIAFKRQTGRKVSDRATPYEDEQLYALVEERGLGRGAGPAEARVLVGELLELLSEPQRAAVLLLAGLGHEAEDAAAVMGCPVDTARTRLWYARRRMAEAA